MGDTGNCGDSFLNPRNAKIAVLQPLRISGDTISGTQTRFRGHHKHDFGDTTRFRGHNTNYCFGLARAGSIAADCRHTNRVKIAVLQPLECDRWLAPSKRSTWLNRNFPKPGRPDPARRPQRSSEPDGIRAARSTWSTSLLTESNRAFARTSPSLRTFVNIRAQDARGTSGHRITVTVY